VEAAVSAKAPPPEVIELTRRIAALEREHDALKRDLAWFTLRFARRLRALEAAMRRRAA
jgi:hypothetical protein